MEELSEQPRFERQERVLQAYCRDAEKKLRRAKNLREALRARDEVCARFKRDCVSDVLVSATLTYLDSIISHRWQNESTET